MAPDDRPTAIRRLRALFMAAKFRDASVALAVTFVELAMEEPGHATAPGDDDSTVRDGNRIAASKLDVAPQLPTEEPDLVLTIAEYDAVLRPYGTVSFDQLVDAAYLRNPRFAIEPRLTEAYERYYPELLKKFGESHKAIERSYFGRNVRAVALLTKDRELFVQYPERMFEDVEFLELLSRLMLLHVRARQFLSEGDYKDCMDPVFEAITYCLSSFDQQPRGSVGEDEQAMKAHKAAHKARLTAMLSNAYDRAESDLWQMAQRKALIQYFGGMLAGLVLLIYLAVILGFVTVPLLPLPPSLTPEQIVELRTFSPNYLLQVATIAGAIGAGVSVLQRISAGRFSLSRNVVVLQQARRSTGRRAYTINILKTLGLFRPVIGAVFGVAFYVFQSAGLLPFIPKDDVSLPVYFAALAFIAGFSERFARDMVITAQAPLADAAPLKGSPTTGTTSGSSDTATPQP